MKIYIASSWSNVHGVEMLAARLRKEKHEVSSFTEHGPKPGELDKWGGFEGWIQSESGQNKFDWDMEAIANADVVVYLGPSGADSWAEIGYANGRVVPVYGLTSWKREPIGINRLMVAWLDSVDTFIEVLEAMEEGA